MKPYAENRRARHDYETLESYEGGLELLGHEVKSIRMGGANLTGAYVRLEKGELWLIGAKIRPYPPAGPLPFYDQERPRRILLHAQEIASLAGKSQAKGLTFVPFSLYPRGHHIKLSFGLCRGRKTYDSREKLKERTVERETQRFMRSRDDG